MSHAMGAATSTRHESHSALKKQTGEEAARQLPKEQLSVVSQMTAPPCVARSDAGGWWNFGFTVTMKMSDLAMGLSRGLVSREHRNTQTTKLQHATRAVNDIVHTTPRTGRLQRTPRRKDGTKICLKAHQRASGRSHSTPPIPTAAPNERATMHQQNPLPMVTHIGLLTLKMGALDVYTSA
jgi:hypothetical protein